MKNNELNKTLNAVKGGRLDIAARAKRGLQLVDYWIELP